MLVRSSPHALHPGRHHHHHDTTTEPFADLLQSGAVCWLVCVCCHVSLSLSFSICACVYYKLYQRAGITRTHERQQPRLRMCVCMVCGVCVCVCKRATTCARRWPRDVQRVRINDDDATRNAILRRSSRQKWCLVARIGDTYRHSHAHRRITHAYNIIHSHAFSARRRLLCTFRIKTLHRRRCSSALCAGTRRARA